MPNPRGAVRKSGEANPPGCRARTAQEKDRHRDRNWAPSPTTTRTFSLARRTAAHRKSMVLFGMFRRKARTHGLRWRELLGRRNTYGQKFGSPKKRVSNRLSTSQAIDATMVSVKLWLFFSLNFIRTSIFLRAPHPVGVHSAKQAVAVGQFCATSPQPPSHPVGLSLARRSRMANRLGVRTW